MTSAGSYRRDHSRTAWPVWRKALRALFYRSAPPLDLPAALRLALRRKLDAASRRPAAFQAAIGDALDRAGLSSRAVAALDVSTINERLRQASDALGSNEALVSAIDALPRRLRLLPVASGAYHSMGLAVLDAIVAVTDADDDNVPAAKAIHAIAANLTQGRIDDRLLPPDAYPVA